MSRIAGFDGRILWWLSLDRLRLRKELLLGWIFSVDVHFQKN